MTSPLLGKRRTIQVLLAIAAASSLPLTGSVRAQLPPRRLPIEQSPNQTTAEKLREIEAKTQAIRPVQLDELYEEAEEAFFKIETKPPTPDKLFRIGSEDDVLQNTEVELKERDPRLFFLLPGPMDWFDNPNSETLGALWIQKIRASGQMSMHSERVGVIGVFNNKGQYPYDPQLKDPTPEVAIMTEAVGQPDIFATVEVELGGPNALFGIVFRADNPDLLNYFSEKEEVINEFDANSFYYALASPTKIEIHKRIKGEDTLLSTANIPAKNSFEMAVVAHGKQLIAFRDKEVVLRASDDELMGEYVGVAGVKVDGKPTRFDNFYAEPYGGPFAAKTFARTDVVFPGANVHHQPLYFEQLAVERFGQHYGNLFQPWIAHSMFFADALFLPYSIGKSPPWACTSAEGYPLPGDVVLPFHIYLPVWDLHGVGLQTAVWSLGFSLIP